MTTKKTKTPTALRNKRPSLVAPDRISAFHKRVTLGFLAISALLVLLILYFSLAQVKIYLTPQITTLESSFTIEVQTNSDKVLAGTKIVPGTITTTSFKTSKTFTVPAGNEVAGIARGQVTIINNYSRNQVLVRTTRLLTPSGLLFRLADNVNVPAGGQVTVEAYADTQGPEYDIVPTKFTIPGLWEGLRDYIYAESYEPFRGGRRLEKTITSEILEKSASEVVKLSADEAKNKLEPNPDQIILYALDETTWNSDVEIGQTTDAYQITAQTPVTKVEFSRADLHKIASAELIAKTPANQQFISANFDSLRYELQTVDEQKKTATIVVYLQGRSASRLKKEDLNIEKIQGLSKTELLTYLQSLPSIADINIVFIPGWLKKVPSLPNHIYIEIIK